MRGFYRLPAEEVIADLGSSRNGLPKAEAAKRLSQFGANALVAIKRESYWQKYLRQYKDLMIVLLMASALIAGVLLGDTRTALVLAALVIVNTSIGFFQEYKAERTMESLEKLIHPVAKALRNDSIEEIPSADLVQGDIAYIEEGDSVPADLRVIEESELSTNDFALTGESNPSRKFTHAISAEVELADRHNQVFMGTTVATGHAYGIVIATGMRTELGRIASLSQETTSDQSPLQKEMGNIAKRVSQGTVLLGMPLALIAWKGGLSVHDSFLYAVGIASSLIPQGLPAEINASLAQAAGSLARAKALVKKLSAVETLGSTSIICTDKTGTLTKNEMTVQHITIGKKSYGVSGTGYQPTGEIFDTIDDRPLTAKELGILQPFFETGVYASNAHIGMPDETHATWYIVGDPTEGSLITLARKAGLDDKSLQLQNPELKEFAFDSARKRMSSVRKLDSSDRLYVFVKGAPENILERCVRLWDHGRIKKITNADREFYLEKNNMLANQAMRNLAFAYRTLPGDTNLSQLSLEEAEDDLTFLGLVSMVDPLRDEVPDAMQAAHAANIKISIITGDYAPTAKAIATKARLAEGVEKLVVVSGEELRKLEDSQLLNLAYKGGVIFSRVAPEDKLRIVNLVKSVGKVVAVTGDGINDAPALKRADIGVAMGLTGTDVAKQSAEIILLDDSFNTLVGAIKQGRIIFQNIKKGTLSCFTSNGAELVVNLTSLGASAIFHIPLALTVMEILAVDLIAELFPIAALGWDDAEQELMHEPPRDPNDHILNRRSIADLLWCGLLIGGFAFANYLFFYTRHGASPFTIHKDSYLYAQATAMTYLTIVLCQLANILQRRSPRGFFTRFQFTNRRLWIAIALSLFFVGNIIYNPWIAPYFGAGRLGYLDWVIALMTAAMFILIREAQRMINDYGLALAHQHKQQRSYETS